MLKFSLTNIFSYNKVVEWFAPLATKTILLPFQFHITSLLHTKKIELINGTQSVDITANIDVETYKTTLLSDGSWIVYKGASAVNSTVCGIWQLKITLSSGGLQQIWYSNFFRIVDYSFYYIQFYRANDLTDRLYNSITYKDKIYFYPNQLKRLENFEYIENQSIGDGLNQTEYQMICEQYRFFAYVDKFALQFFNELQHNMIINIYHPILLPGGAEIAIDNIEKETTYIPETDMYEIAIIFKVNKKEYTLCQTSFRVTEFQGEEFRTVNAGGDFRTVNAGADYRVVTEEV